MLLQLRLQHQQNQQLHSNRNASSSGAGSSGLASLGAAAVMATAVLIPSAAQPLHELGQALGVIPPALLKPPPWICAGYRRPASRPLATPLSRQSYAACGFALRTCTEPTLSPPVVRPCPSALPTPPSTHPSLAGVDRASAPAPQWLVGCPCAVLACRGSRAGTHGAG